MINLTLPRFGPVAPEANTEFRRRVEQLLNHELGQLDLSPLACDQYLSPRVRAAVIEVVTRTAQRAFCDENATLGRLIFPPLPIAPSYSGRTWFETGYAEDS